MNYSVEQFLNAADHSFSHYSVAVLDQDGCISEVASGVMHTSIEDASVEMAELQSITP